MISFLDMLKRYFFIIILICSNNSFAQTEWKINKSDINEMIIEFSTNNLENYNYVPVHIVIGIPNNIMPKLEVINLDKISITKSKLKKILRTEWINKQKINGLYTATLRYNPQIEKDIVSLKSLVKVRFSNNKPIDTIKPKKIHHEILKNNIENWDVAKNWINNNKIKKIKNNNYPSGIWIKFYVYQDGIKKINGQDLNSIIDEEIDFDPRSIMVFTSSSRGRSLTEKITNDPYNIKTDSQNLIELPINIMGESDGNLSNSDYLNFYANGPSGYDIEGKNLNWNQNLYFNKTTYWLLIPDDSSLRGKRIKTVNKSSPSNFIITYGQSNLRSEIDIINPNSSGLLWGEKFIQKEQVILKEVSIDNPFTIFNSAIKIGLIGNENNKTPFGNTNHKIAFEINNNRIGQTEWSYTGKKVFETTINKELVINGINSIKMTNFAENINSRPLLDYVDLNYSKKLIYNFPFDFYSPLFDTEVDFQLIGQDLVVWNTTEFDEPLNMPLTVKNDTILFTTFLSNDKNQKFTVFKPDDIQIVNEFELIRNDIDWTSLKDIKNRYEHIIIGPKEFEGQSKRLVNHRKNSIFVDVNLIYQQFSGGNKDPIAIRSFLNFANNDWDVSPIYVLIMGDTDFDYRNITLESKSLVPSIQVGYNDSFVTDDRFVAFNGLIPEISIGRFPAQNETEVINYIDKLIEYENNPVEGDWKQRMILVADDPIRPEKNISDLYVGKSHTLNSERLYKIIPNYIDVEKVYLINHEEIIQQDGFEVQKPSATTKLLDKISQGAGIINFIGHGNATQWTQEKLLEINRDLERINTKMKLPLWIAGTCNWGQFDAIDKESFAEQLIRLEMNGAISVISTTRGITVSGNINFLENMFEKIFQNDSISSSSIGSIMQTVKNGSIEGQLFQLMGDPALKIPAYAIVNNKSKLSSDTLKTLEIGSIESNSRISSGNGYITLRDAPKIKIKKFSLGSQTYEIDFYENGSNLFKGSFDFQNNYFKTQFRIPKDISYSSENAIINYRLLNSNQIEIGSNNKLFLKIGNPSNDVNGPLINFETTNGRFLRDNDFFNPSENIVVVISDPMGINITNEEGHEIIYYNNKNNTKDYTILTERFFYDKNSLTVGKIIIDNMNSSQDLQFGIRAWDNANNPSERFINLKFINSKKFEIVNVMNFPNPFSNQTKFTFEISNEAEVHIDIYTLEGKKIKILNPIFCQVGFNKINWDGKDEFGNILANGVYLYKVNAINLEGEKINKVGRLAIFK